MGTDFNPKDFKLLFNIKKMILIQIAIYGNNEKSIISYNLINKEKINEIKNAHQKHITNIRHHLDTINKRDLFLSLSAKDYNVKVWNVNNFQ